MSVQVLEKPRARRYQTLYDNLREQGVIKGVAERGFAEMQWDPTWVAKFSKDARDGLWRMLASPERDLFKYREATEADDQGLFDRNGEGKTGLSLRERAEKSTAYDNKWFFHCYPWTRETLRKQGAPVDEYVSFFRACDEFNHQGMRLAVQIAQGLDEINESESPHRRYPGSLMERITRAPVVTRLLRYKSKSADAPLGKVHRDRSAMTLHWHSSHPGLRVFDPEKRAVPVHDSDASKILAFLSERSWPATRGRFGTGVLHGASNLVHGFEADDERFVAVTFVHCKLDYKDLLWKEANLGQLQIDPADYPLQALS